MNPRASLAWRIQGALKAWVSQPLNGFALVLLLDQFTRVLKASRRMLCSRAYLSQPIKRSRRPR